MAHWFKSEHWTCWRPFSWQGWIVTSIYALSVLFIFFKIDVNSHSVSDTLINMTIPFIVLSLIFIIICKKASSKRKS
ncbi:MAG: hypothetical protein AABX23_04990 [Nanoarchaeota archaeon]